MNIIKKILKIAVKVVIGMFAFYLLVSLVLIPLVVPWVAGSQASKLLKAKVKVRAVQFNPFLLRFTVKGLKISDAHNQAMVEFDTFLGDISFLGLLKKSYRVESLSLEGLKVNVVLTQDGMINLMGLVPVPSAKSVTDVQKLKPKDPGPQDKKALPSVTVDLLSLHDGTIRFTDQSVTPNFSTSLSGIDVRIVGLSTRPEAETKVTFTSKLDEKGIISTEALLKPFASPLALEAVFKLNDYALGVLTPYVAKFAGRTVKDGKLNLSMDYRIADNKLIASHKILVQSFDFGERVVSKDALNLPFGLAVALLEDSQNRITISLPVDGDMSKPDFHYFHLIGKVIRNFFFKLVTKPFSIVGSIVGSESGSEEMGFVRFSPGKTDLSSTEKEKLNTIVKALKERPRLNLQVKGGFDPVVDWRTIKKDVLVKDFQVLKEESKRLESWVYQELYQRRFGIKALWKLTASYRSNEGVYDDAKINEEIRRQLIEEGSADKVALAALAEARAKVVYDFIVAAGFDVTRVGIGEVQEGQGSAEGVPSELVLTVFDTSSTAQNESLLPAEAK